MKRNHSIRTQLRLVVAGVVIWFGSGMAEAAERIKVGIQVELFEEVDHAILSDGVPNQRFWPQQPILYQGFLFQAMTRVEGGANEIGSTSDWVRGVPPGSSGSLMNRTALGPNSEPVQCSSSEPSQL